MNDNIPANQDQHITIKTATMHTPSLDQLSYFLCLSSPANITNININIITNINIKIVSIIVVAEIILDFILWANS